MRLQIKLNRSLKRDLAPGDRRLWLLRSVALRIERSANPLWVFEVFHRRLLIALGTMAVAGYLLAASGLFFWLNRQPHNQVGWFDLALPWHWPGLSEKRGDTAILAGLDSLERREYVEAFYQLRVGLARSPGNVEGRLALVRMFAGHDSGRAVMLLEEGLPHAPNDERLIAALFELYGLLQVQDRALAKADELLQKHPTGPALLLLQRAKVAILLQQRRFADAEAAISAIGTPEDPEERQRVDAMRLELLVRSNRAAEAHGRALALVDDSATPSNLLRQCGEVAIATGDVDLLQRVLRRLRAREPNAPEPYLYAIQAWRQMNRISLQAAAEQEYFSLFGNNDGALQALAALAVGLDLPDLVSRARQAAGASRLSQFAYRVHQTEIALRHGEAGAAMRSLLEWEGAVGTLSPQQRFYPEFIRRLTLAAFAGTPDRVTALLALLTANRYQARLPIYEFAFNMLEKAGQLDAAEQVIRAGAQLYPYSAPMLAGLQQIENRRAALAANPSAPVETAAVELPANEKQALKLIDRHLADSDLPAARALLRAIRAQKPAWLAAIEAELGVREVELNFISLDGVAARSAARNYLDRYRKDADVLRLVELARRLAERNRVSDARLLQEEIAASSSGSSSAVIAALRALNLPDDLAAQTATQAGALAALDQMITASDWTQAERLLRQLRERPPLWLEGAASEVKAREVLVRLGLDQRPLALGALKDLVVKGGAARGLAFRLVREMLARGERDNAQVLAREVVRLLPDDPASARLLKEAEAPALGGQ